MIRARSQQRGVALIVALLVVALATILIAALLDRGQLAQARTRNLLRDQQAADYARGLEDYAAHVLAQDFLRGEPIDTNDEIWAIPLPPTPVPGGEITATMSDLNGRFNLNNLSDPVNKASWDSVFVRLLTTLKLDPALARNVEDWMSKDPSSGSSDAWYAGQAVPYRSGQRMFAHVSELRLVKGFDPQTYARILPHVTALPVGTRINVNTATLAVLTTLADNYTEQAAAGPWQQGHAHYSCIPLGSSQCPDNSQPALPTPDCAQCFDYRSNYFQARGDITLDGLTFTFYSVLERRMGVGLSGGISVLQRSRGGD